MNELRKLKYELPCNEKDLAFLAVLVSDEIKIEDGITALVRKQRLGEIFVGFIAASHFIHHHFLILNLEHHEPIVPLRF